MPQQTRLDLLLVDDDDEYRGTIVRWFTRRGGYAVHDAESGEQAIELAQQRDFHVAVFDMIMPGQTGIELLEKLKSSQPECEIIMLTGKGTIETAVQAMKLGAYDFLTKPFPLADLEKLVQKASERRTLKKENAQLKTLIKRGEPDTDMIGQSPAMRQVFRLIERAGPSEKAILIEGESGTGKELVACSLHRHSPRADKPLVIVNCAALPESLLESELFGHEKGAFTGAVSAKPGLFEVADGSTLFIDEIGELPGALQAKLLRVLEDGSFRRIGSLKERRVDVRLLAATNRVMAREVEAGNFREDLYYRINVMSLQLPPLRERQGDVELLLDRFTAGEWTLAVQAKERLLRYSWPGNVRQLINAIERAKIMSDDGIICIEDLPPEILDDRRQHVDGGAEPEDLATIERGKVLEILRRESGNKARAARRLGIERRKIYRLIEKYDIQEAEVTDE